jgi:1L-myo-inositol 1-phosphate cytidylyltransferase
LIIAAGEGTRLASCGPSKPLVAVRGVPLIEHAIRSARRAGVGDFCVVTGYRSDEVRGFLDEMSTTVDVSISHVVNDDWRRGNGVSVLAARDRFVEPFLLLMSDHLVDWMILRNLIVSPPGEGEITLAVDHNLSNPLVDLDDVTRVRSEAGKLTEIGKGLAQYNGFDTGIFFCMPAMFTALDQSISEYGEESLSGGVRVLAGVRRVNTFDIGDRFWLDVDSPATMEQAEATLAARVVR